MRKLLTFLTATVVCVLVSGCASNNNRSVVVCCKTRDTNIDFNKELSDRVEINLIGTPGLRRIDSDCSDDLVQLRLHFDGSGSLPCEQKISAVFDQVIKEKMVSKQIYY